jgi:hypothetical protein
MDSETGTIFAREINHGGPEKAQRSQNNFSE